MAYAGRTGSCVKVYATVTEDNPVPSVECSHRTTSTMRDINTVCALRKVKVHFTYLMGGQGNHSEIWLPCVVAAKALNKGTRACWEKERSGQVNIATELDGHALGQDESLWRAGGTL